MAHRRGWARHFGHGAGPFDQPSRSASRTDLLPQRTSRVGPVAHLLGAEAVHLEYPTQVVFESVTVGVSDGDRIGIVGRNGDGKSSLLGLLTGQLRPDPAGSPSAADCASAR